LLEACIQHNCPLFFGISSGGVGIQYSWSLFSGIRRWGSVINTLGRYSLVFVAGGRYSTQLVAILLYSSLGSVVNTIGPYSLALATILGLVCGKAGLAGAGYH